jgi:hypothetical protein
MIQNTNTIRDGDGPAIGKHEGKQGNDLIDDNYITRTFDDTYLVD